MPRHLTLVTDHGPMPEGPVQLGLAMPGMPDADRSFWDLPIRDQVEAHLDATPGQRDMLTVVDDVIGQLELLVDGLPPEERARTAERAYLDADGAVRSRHQLLRPVPRT